MDTNRIAFAARRPDLVRRRLLGLPLIEISLDEIGAHVPDPKVIIEAGALDGTDTALIAAKWPGATVHAFEPVPSAFAKTIISTQHLPNVRRYQLALSDQTGSQAMHVSSAADGSDRPDSSSLLAPTGHLKVVPQVRFDEVISVETMTLGDWGRRERVGDIDIMWLDMQGMELPMLRAAEEMLSTTRGVMMEVSRREMYADSPLYPEVVAWMSSRGFRLLIDRVSFHFGNALFVRARN